MWIGRTQSNTKKNPGIESICYPASITRAALQSMHEIHTLLVAIGGESEKGQRIHSARVLSPYNLITFSFI